MEQNNNNHKNTTKKKSNSNNGSSLKGINSSQHATSEEFNSSTYDTTDSGSRRDLSALGTETLPGFDSSLPSENTLKSDTSALKTIQQSQQGKVILDKNNNPVTEFAFQEKVALPRDLTSDDVRLIVDKYGFTIICAKEQPEDSQVQTQSYHRLEYTRMFDRPIKEVYMEITEGIILVAGEFSDYNL